MRKELTERDQQIDKLTTACEEAREANAALLLRIEHADKQLNNMEQRSIAHMQVIEEQQHEMDQKMVDLHNMQKTNQELESYLRELRRNDGSEMDASVECVDTSFVSGIGGPSADRSSRSDSTGSPQQTLAQTVIDVQLREEQVRNQQLRDQLEAEQRDNAAKLDELRNELVEMQAVNQSLRTTCQLEHMQRLIDLANAMRTQQNEHEEANSKSFLEQEYLRTENTELLDQVTRLNSVNQDLVKQVTKKEVEIDGMGKENSDLVRQRQELKGETESLNELASKLEANLQEHQRVQNALEAEEIRLKDCMRTLNTQVDMLSTAKSELTADNTKQQQQIIEVQQSMRLLAEKLSHVENKYDEINAEKAQLCKSKDDLQAALNSAESIRSKLEIDISNLKTINEEQIKLNGERQVQCLQLSEELVLVKQTALRLENENRAFKLKQTDLLEHTERLEAASKIFRQNAAEMSETITEMKTKNENLGKQVCDKLAQLQLMDTNKNELFAELTDVKEKFVNTELHLMKSNKINKENMVLLANLSDERTQLLDRISSMGKALIDQRTEFEEVNDALNLQISDNQQMLVELRVECEGIKQQLLDDCHEIEQLKGNKEENEKLKLELTSSLQTLQSDKEQLLLSLDTLKSELEGVNYKSLEQEEVKRNLEIDLCVKSHTLADTEAKLDEAQRVHRTSSETQIKEKDALQADLNEFSAKCKFLEELKQSLETDLKNKSNELTSTESKLELYEAEQTELVLALSQEIEALQNAMQTINETCYIVEQEKQNLNDENNAKSTELSSSKAELLQTQKELKTAFETIANIKSQQSAATFELQELQMTHEKYIQNAVDERVQLVSSIDKLKHQLEASQSHVDQLKTNTTRQEDTVRQLEAEHNDLQTRLADKEKESSSHWRTVNDLMATVETLEKSVQEKTAERDQAYSTVDEAKAELQRQLQSAQDDCVQLTNELNEVTKQLDTISAERNNLNAKLDAQDRYYRSNVDTLKINLQETKNEHELMKSQMVSLQKTHSDLHNNLEAKTHALIDESDKLVKLQEEHKRSTDNYQKLQDLLKEQTEEHKASLDILRAKSDEAMTSVLEKLNNIDSEKAKLLEEFTQTSEEVKYLRTEKEDLTKLLSTTNMECAQHKQSIEDNLKSLANCKEDLQATQHKFEEVTQQLVAAKDEYAKLVAEHENIMAEQENSKQQLQTLTEQLSTMISNYNDLVAEQPKRNATISQLTKRQEELEEANAKLQGQLAETQSQAQSDHSAVIASARQLELQIIAMKSQMITIEAERDSLLAQIKDASEQSNGNAEKLTNLSAEYTKQNEQLLQQTQLITDKSTEIQDLRQQLKDQSKHSNEKYEDLQSKLKAAQTVANDLNEQLKQSKDAAAKVSQELADSRKDVIGMTSEIKNVTKTIEQLEADKKELALQISNSKAKCEELGDNKISLVENMDTFVKRIKRLEEEKEELARDVVVAMSFKDRLIELEHEVAERTTIIQELEQRFAELGALFGVEGSPSNSDVIQVVQRLQETQQKELHEQQIALQAERENTAKLSTELETLQSNSTEVSNKTISKLKSELALITADRNELNSNLEDYVKLDMDQKQSISIFRAKLLKERENAAAAQLAWNAERAQHLVELKASENRVTETRSELEGKLEKMKSRMVSFFY